MKLNANGSEMCPGGTFENSPAFQRRGMYKRRPSPEGTAEINRRLSRPFGTYSTTHPHPALKRRAILMTSLRDIENINDSTI